MTRPRLLDLFCGAGGCSVGYHRAGFEVVGVDHRPMPRYPFEFVQADALEYLARHGREYEVIHASPPCQKFSVATRVRGENNHADLLTPTVKLLQDTGNPWVMENVMGAPMSPWSVMLCGLMFGLKIFRHRLFEASTFIFSPEHPSHNGYRIGEKGFVTVAGHGGGTSWQQKQVLSDHRNKASWVKAMKVDWMTRDELAQAIPPAYCEFIGKEMLRILGA